AGSMRVAVVMVVIVIMVVSRCFDDADERLAIDHETDPRMGLLFRRSGDDGGKRFAGNFKIGGLPVGFAFLRHGGQRVLGRLAVDRGVDGDRLGLDRLGRFGVAAEKIDADAMGLVVVCQLGVVVFVPELNDVAAVGPFVPVIVGMLVGMCAWIGAGRVGGALAGAQRQCAESDNSKQRP